MKDKKKNEMILYILLTALGFVSLWLPNLIHVNYVDSISTAIWIVSFLYLTESFPSGRYMLITAAVFVSGFFLKYLGTVDFEWLYTLLFLFAGLVHFGIFFGYSKLIRRWDRFLTTLAFPVLWMVVYLLAIWARFPSLIRVDMMFVDMSVLSQAEGLIGSFGLSFVLLWIFSLVSFAIRNRKLAPAAVGTGLYLAALLIGVVHLYPNMTACGYARIALSTGPYVGDYLNYTSLPMDRYLASMRSCMAEAAGQGADILAFNEETYEFDDVEEAEFLEECSRAARENRIHVLLGLDLRDTDGSEGGKSQNKVVWISQNGEILGSYLKTKTIPLLETDYVRGDGEIPSHVIQLGDRQVKVSYLICYDSNFPLFVNRMDDDTDILFLPSWDWPTVTVSHAKLCRAIALENRVSVVKPTYDGINIAVRPDGSIVGSFNTDETGYETIQIMDVPIKRESVFTQGVHEKDNYVYSIIGVEILSILVCLLLMYGSIYENSEKTPRNRQYIFSLLCCIIALTADAVSWMLDGCKRLEPVLYASTMISLIMTFVLNGAFIRYITEYVREKQPVSFAISRIYRAVAAVIIGLLALAVGSGRIFSFDDGVYQEGPLYSGYIVANLICVFLCLLTNLIHMRSRSKHDRIATLSLVLLPFTAGCINLFVTTFSYAYPASVLSLLVLYIMIQSERQNRLQKEGSLSYHYARHDTLTGLYNRLAYEERLNVLSQSPGMLGVLFTDVNGLKITNDNYGHEAGDQLLKRYADLLNQHFRKSEIFRISGDEFTVLLENIDETAIHNRMNEFRETLKNEVGFPMASVGLAYGSSKDAKQLIKSAETEMYTDKAAFYKAYPEMNKRR